MKTYLLMLLLVFSMRIFSQDIYDKENEISTFNEYANIEKGKSLNISLPETNENHLYKCGVYLEKSANYKYFALGSLAAGIILSSAGSNSNDTPDSNKNKDLYYVMSGIFFTSSIVCTIISINYKLKAGKQLKISANGTSARISYTY
ncbi:MAG: hypothetical protein H6Q12_550 [Bacteroidetes bacterium]|nr:hypothetical protein [Bacteroidota bacterium]